MGGKERMLQGWHCTKLSVFVGYLIVKQVVICGLSEKNLALVGYSVGRPKCSTCNPVATLDGIRAVRGAREQRSKLLERF